MGVGGAWRAWGVALFLLLIFAPRRPQKPTLNKSWLAYKINGHIRFLRCGGLKYSVLVREGEQITYIQECIPLVTYWFFFTPILFFYSWKQSSSVSFGYLTNIRVDYIYGWIQMKKLLRIVDFQKVLGCGMGVGLEQWFEWCFQNILKNCSYVIKIKKYWKTADTNFVFICDYASEGHKLYRLIMLSTRHHTLASHPSMRCHQSCINSCVIE